MVAECSAAESRALTASTVDRQPRDRLDRGFPEPQFLREVLSEGRFLVGFVAFCATVALAYFLLVYFLDIRVGMTGTVTLNQTVYSVALGAMLSLAIVTRQYAGQYGLCAPLRDRNVKPTVGLAGALAGIASMFVGCGGTILPLFVVAAAGGASAASFTGYLLPALVVVEAGSLLLLWIPIRKLAKLWFVDVHGAG